MKSVRGCFLVICCMALLPLALCVCVTFRSSKEAFLNDVRCMAGDRALKLWYDEGYKLWRCFLPGGTPFSEITIVFPSEGAVLTLYREQTEAEDGRAASEVEAAGAEDKTATSKDEAAEKSGTQTGAGEGARAASENTATGAEENAASAVTGQQGGSPSMAIELKNGDSSAANELQGGDTFAAIELRNGDTLAAIEPETSYTLQLKTGTGAPYETRIAFYTGEGLPTLYVDLSSGSIDYIERKKGNQETAKYTLTDASGSVAREGQCRFRGHGNTSWAEQKKSYDMKLPEEASLLHMGAASKWLLLANASDETVIRSGLAFDIARGLGAAYTPEGVFVNLYFNGAYRGCYLLMQKPDVAEGYLMLRDLESENLAANGVKDADDFEAAEKVSEATSGKEGQTRDGKEAEVADGKEGQTADGKEAEAASGKEGQTAGGEKIEAADGGEGEAADKEEDKEAGKRKTETVDAADSLPAVLSEKAQSKKASLQRKEKSVRLPASPEDISGGYLMEFSGIYAYEDARVGFTTDRRYVLIKSPNNATEAEVSYIASLVRAAEDALYGKDGIDPESGRSYADYLDLTSFMEQFWLEEFFCNIDMEVNSFLLWKDAGDPLLHAGPVWDMDKVMWDPFFSGQWLETRSLYVLSAKEAEGNWGEYPWLTRLYMLPEFHDALMRYWRETFRPALERLMEERFAEEAAQMTHSVEMNSARWDKDWRTFGEAAEETREWIARRMVFFDAYTAAEDTFCHVRFVTASAFRDLVYCAERDAPIGILPQALGVAGWQDENGRIYTEDTIITKDVVLYPVEEPEE